MLPWRGPLSFGRSSRRKVPAIYGIKEFAASGGLMTYASDLTSQFHRAAGYVDKILKGAKPADKIRADHQLKDGKDTRSVSTYPWIVQSTWDGKPLLFLWCRRRLRAILSEVLLVLSLQRQALHQRHET